MLFAMYIWSRWNDVVIKEVHDNTQKSSSIKGSRLFSPRNVSKNTTINAKQKYLAFAKVKNTF